VRIANRHTFETTEKHEPDQLATTYESQECRGEFVRSESRPLKRKVGE